MTDPILPFPPISGSPPRASRRGDKPKPSAIKAAEGYRGGKRRIDPLEPKPEEVTGVPPPPAHLDELAARIWTEELAPLVIRMKVLTVADQIALSVLCQLESRRRVLEDDLKEGGKYFLATTTAGDTVEKTRPQGAELERLIPQIWVGLREFGLTPSSRGKVQMVPGQGRAGQGVGEGESGDGTDGGKYFGKR